MAGITHFTQEDLTMDFRSIVEQRSAMLQKTSGEMRLRLETAPEGRLHVIRQGNRYQYYQRCSGKETNGRYLRKSETKLIKALAQKEYDNTLLPKVLREDQILNMYLQKIPEDPFKSVNLKVKPGVLAMADSVYISDEDYVRHWLDFEYEGLSFKEGDAEFFTRKHERVRSKSEILIANALAELGIPYRYECPLHLPGRTVYPDFTALNVRKRRVIYIEHMGLLLDPDYCESALKKIHAYEAAGYYIGRQVLIFHETLSDPLDMELVYRKLSEFLL